MNNAIVVWVLQGVMISALIAVLILMVLPFLPFKVLEITSKPESHVIDVNSSVLVDQNLAIKRAKKILQQSNNRDIIEFVITGNGIPFLFTNSSCRKEVEELIEAGVVFTACQKSIQTLMNPVREDVALLGGVKFVADGWTHSEQLKQDGYVDELA